MAIFWSGQIPLKCTEMRVFTRSIAGCVAGIFSVPSLEFLGPTSYFTLSRSLQGEREGNLINNCTKILVLERFAMDSSLRTGAFQSISMDRIYAATRLGLCRRHGDSGNWIAAIGAILPDFRASGPLARLSQWGSICVVKSEALSHKKARRGECFDHELREKP